MTWQSIVNCYSSFYCASKPSGSAADRKETPDSVSLFCDSLKDDLRRLDLIKRSLCKAEILQVIAKHLDNNSLN